MKQPETEPEEEISSTETSGEETNLAVGSPGGSAESNVEAVPSVPPATDGDSPRHGFSPPEKRQLLAWLPFWGVILLGALLRFWGLGDKPLHHDESLHAYYSLQLLQNTIWQWKNCAAGTDPNCYFYQPWLHGPFQFHAIALVYQLSRWLGAPDNGINTTTVRIAAATLGTVLVGLPYFLRDYLGRLGAWLACFLLAVSPSMVYFSRFAREDIYTACFTLLMVVAALRYVRDRKARWLILAAAGLALSYATKETTFLTIGVFGSFAVGVLIWELGLRTPLRDRFAATRFPLPRSFAPLNVVAYILVLGIVVKFFFGWLKDLSIYVTTPANIVKSDAFVQNLKNITVALIPWLGILLGLFVFSILVREMLGKMPAQGRRRLAAKIDPRSQRLLDTLLTMPWTNWFFALLVGWFIFLVLYTALFTNLRQGIGDGIWQGLYYWLQQQQVDRGGEPWYYYLLLIPLYEQIGVVFGLVGLVRSLLRPTRFRLFLVVWFLGNLFMYSWAAEKMPWLMIHIVLPMTLLAALGLEPCLLLAIRFVRSFWTRRSLAFAQSSENERALAPVASSHALKVGVPVGVVACLGALCAVLLLLPTLQNMYQVSYVHAADSQHEMMVYVQTTVYVNTVMDKIAVADQQIDGGTRQIQIGVEAGVQWPFAWYLRDYPNVCFRYPTTCPSWVGHTPVIIAGGDDNLYNVEQQLGKNYRSQIYVMRGQFDQGYMPPLCVPKPRNPCPYQPYWGVGPALWLSYGDDPPSGASFNLALAIQHIWRWWWQRVPFGTTDGGEGGYQMELFIQNGLNVNP